MGNATAALRAAINRDADIPVLEDALVAEGLAAADGRRSLRTVPRTTTIPWTVPLAISIGIVVATETVPSFWWGIPVVLVALVATYTFGVLIELAARRSPRRQNTAGDAYLVGLSIGWLASIVVFTLRGDSEPYAYLLIYVAPIVVAIAAMYAGRAFGSLGVVLGRLAFLFPVVFLALFIPLFTEEFWLTFADLRWQAGLLGLAVLIPFVLATIAELRKVAVEAFSRGAERLEQLPRETVADNLEGSLRRLPRFTRDLTWVAHLLSIDWIRDLVKTLARAVTRRGGKAHPDKPGGEEEERVERCLRAFFDAKPTTYSTKISAQLEPIVRRRIWLGVPMLVFTVAVGLTAYVYLLIVLIVKAEVAADWAIADPDADPRLAAHFVEVFGIDVPWDPHIALALTGGIVATVVLLAYVLLEDRYKVAVVDAVLHSTVERSLLLGVPYERLQAPVNSIFSKATKLSGRSIVGYEDTNLNAIKQRDEPHHAGNPGGRSVWFKWVPPSNGTVTIDTTGSEFNTLLAVYTGHRVDDLVEVASSAGATKDAASAVRFRARADTVYMVAVDGHLESGVVATGTFQLNLALGTPENDRFATARELPVPAGYGHQKVRSRHRGASPENRFFETTVNAGHEQDEPNHSGTGDRSNGGKSVWYRWTAKSADRMTIDCAGSDFDVVLAVYVGETLETLEKVIDNCGRGGRLTSISFELEPGTVYHLAVDGFEADGIVESGRVRLAYWVGMPPNRVFERAFRLYGPVGTVFGCNHHADTAEGEPVHPDNTGGRSIWYHWTAPATGPATFRTEGSTFDTLLAVYEGGDLDSLELLASNDDREPGVVTSEVSLEVEAEHEYLVVVDGFRDPPAEDVPGAVGARVASGATALSWICPPRNCSLADAERIRGVEGEVAGSNFRSAKEPGEPRHAPGQGGNSIWYAWQAPTWGRYVFDSHGSENDTVVAVYSGRGLQREETGPLHPRAGDEHSLLDRVTPTDPNSLDLARIAVDVVKDTEYRIAIDSLAVGNWPAKAGPTQLKWWRVPSSTDEF